MTRALSLYRRFDKAVLVEMARLVESNPESLEQPGGLFRFKPDARRKLDAISRAITWHMQDERQIAGMAVEVSGYTGRGSNR